MVLAHQCGDEMKHYRLISAPARRAGRGPAGFDRLADGYSPLYQYLRGLRTTVERIAGGPFAREAIAEVRNAQFIAFCDRWATTATAALYARRIQPEEVHHHQLGRELLEKLLHHARAPGARRRRHAQHPGHRRRAAHPDRADHRHATRSPCS